MGIALLAINSSSTDVWTVLNALAAVAMALLAGAALVLVIPQLRHNARSLQLQVFESIFRDIRQLDHIWIEQKFNSGMTKEQRQAWCASFFNTIEYFCFLMNHKLVREEELHLFFDSSFRVWYEQFNNYKAQGLIKDTPEMFTELKKTCRELSSKKPK